MVIREFTRGRFSLDALGNAEFEGFTDGQTWNGWACPYFTYDMALNVLRASTANGYTWRYDEESHSFLVWHDDDPENFEPDKFEESSILVDGADTIVYAVGAFSWAWEIASRS